MAQNASVHPLRLSRVATFVGVGLVLYALLFAAAEVLVRRTGDGNPVHRIITAERPAHDWIVLGASHAMPLDFQDFGARIEAETGRSMLNLAAPGTGPLYHRFVAERYFAHHAAAGVLVVVDSFGFYSDQWNEQRFGDRDLLSRTPFDATTLRLLLRYVAAGVDPKAVLDYATGFSKINNHDRFEPDKWEAETRFTRSARPSDLADSERIDYLYPEPPEAAGIRRYMDHLIALARTARRQNAKVVVVKPPLPARFRTRLPNEDAFDNALREALNGEQIAFYDYSDVLPEPRYYFDPDHLNEEGTAWFLENHLRALLTGEGL